MSQQLLAVMLMAVSFVMSGCQTWPLKHPSDEVGVDAELTTQPPPPTPPAPTVLQEPRPGFEQEPKQTP